MLKKINNFINPGWNSKRASSKINLAKTFSDFKPTGNQNYKTFESLIIKNIQQLIPTMSQIVEISDDIEILDLHEFVELNSHEMSEIIGKRLEDNFNLHNSDKAKNYYHLIYSCLINNLDQNLNILEIGLGTNNEKIVSSMGASGSPGASLKAFKDSLPKAKIFGADFDRKILFNEDRIKTFYVDQTDKPTFDTLFESINCELDLIIDDGLHYQLSNLNTLIASLSKIGKNGYIIIEDIGYWTLDFWKIIYRLIPTGFKPKLIRIYDELLIFIVQRID